MLAFRPLPVYADDMPLITLRTAELFVVCSLRLWVSHDRDPDCPMPHWREGFAAAGIEADAALRFDELLCVIMTCAARSLDVRGPRCGHLSEDEGRLLQTLNLLQRNRIAEAAAIFGRWLPPSAVRLATGQAQALAGALIEARLRIPLRGALGAGTRRSGSSMNSGRGWNLVH